MKLALFFIYRWEHWGLEELYCPMLSSYKWWHRHMNQGLSVSKKPACFFCDTWEPTTVNIFARACFSSVLSNVRHFRNLSEWLQNPAPLLDAAQPRGEQGKLATWSNPPVRRASKQHHCLQGTVGGKSLETVRKAQRLPCPQPAPCQVLLGESSPPTPRRRERL